MVSLLHGQTWTARLRGFRPALRLPEFQQKGFAPGRWWKGAGGDLERKLRTPGARIPPRLGMELIKLSGFEYLELRTHGDWVVKSEQMEGKWMQ